MEITRKYMTTKILHATWRILRRVCRR
jgi:hypothetical protein